MKKLKGANPHIVIMRKPVISGVRYNEQDFDDSMPPLYQGFITDRHLKISFVAIQNDKYNTFEQKEDPTYKAYRDFQVVRYDGLFLHRIDKNKSIDPTEKSGTMSVNPELVHLLFQDVLDPYGIVLNKVTMHDYTDYESVDFSFTDSSKKELLEDMIDNYFKKNL